MESTLTIADAMLLFRNTLRGSSNEFVVHEVMDFQRKILNSESGLPPDPTLSTMPEERVDNRFCILV
jgi:hypothetical protein